MNWKSFALGALGGGLVVAACAIGLAFLSYKAQSKTPADETITFPDKFVFDSKDDSYVMVRGTISGDHVGYRNNTMTAICLKDEMRCEVGYTAQIGADQVSEIDVDDWKITQWNPLFVSAQFVGTCSTTTLNVNRSSEEVGYVIIPTNQASPQCDKSESRIMKWTIESSLNWRRWKR